LEDEWPCLGRINSLSSARAASGALTVPVVEPGYSVSGTRSFPLRLRQIHAVLAKFRRPLGEATSAPIALVRRGPLLWRVQFALKPASQALGLHGVFKRGKGLDYLIADSAFKRMQVDAPGACWLDADEHHLSLALRTGGAPDCSEWNDGR
jgi:hypothetical protein